MRKRFTCFFLLFFLLSQGCVRVPEHDLAPMTDSTGVETVVDQALGDGGFSVGEWPSSRWWESLKDPILTSLIEEAIHISPTLQGAEARLRAAAQVAWEKRAALFPELDFVATDSWQHLSKYGFFRGLAPFIPAVVNDVNLDFSFSYEFDFWGKYRDIFHAALGEAAAMAAEKKQAELVLTTSIGYAYAELQFLLRKQQILEQELQNRKAIDAIRKKRQENALDTSQQNLTARSNTLDISAALAEVGSLIAQQIHQIKALAGVGQDYDVTFVYNDLKPLQVALPECLSLDLIARRPDLIAQKSRVEAAAKLIDAAKTDFYPNVNLQALIGLESIFWPKLFRVSSYSATITPAIHLPIFTAGRLRAQLREKVADFNDAVYSYNELILQAAQQVADSLTQIHFLQKEIEVRSTSLEVALRQEQLIEQRFTYALDDRINLLDAQFAILEAMLTLESLEYAKQLAGIILIRDLGGGYHES